MSFPGEVEKAVEAARGEVGGKDRRLVYVADRKVFSQMQGLGEDFVIRVYWDRKRGNVVSLKEAVASLPFASRGEVRLKLGEGGYQKVDVGLGWREAEQVGGVWPVSRMVPTRS